MRLIRFTGSRGINLIWFTVCDNFQLNLTSLKIDTSLTVKIVYFIFSRQTVKHFSKLLYDFRKRKAIRTLTIILKSELFVDCLA